MIRPVLILAALVAVLALADLWLARREARARAEERKVGALFTPEEADRLRKQPALRVELSGETHSYGRIEGQWRCLSYQRAPVDARALQALLDGIVQAEGIVYSEASEEAPTYGINTPRTLRVSIQGPRATQDKGGDVLATLEIGLAQPGREGCFVRKKGTRAIWSIASDLRAPLEHRVASGLPPLLEAAAVPSAWLAQGGAQRITLEPGSAQLVLERRDRELDPSTLQPGALPWKWVLGSVGSEHELDLEASGAFASFLEHLPYVGVLDSRQSAALGLTPPQAVVTLAARTGAPLRLEFGARDAQGRVALWVAASETLYQIDGSTFDLALPTSAVLTAEYPEEDPWSAALRAQVR